MKAVVRARKNTAAFELLCDTMADRECSGCGLIYGGGESPFYTFDEEGNVRNYEVTEMRFCPQCGKRLRPARDVLERRTGR